MSLVKKLVPKRRLFVQYYVTVANMNGAKAARMAGYSEKTAKAIANLLLAEPEVRAAVDEYLDMASMNASETLKRLTDWGRGSIEPFLREDGSIDLNTPQARENLHLIKKIEVAGKDENGKPDKIRIELHDAKDAVTQIAKVHGMFVERVEHSGEVSGVLRVPQLTANVDWEEAARAQQAALPVNDTPIVPLLLKGDSGTSN